MQKEQKLLKNSFNILKQYVNAVETFEFTPNKFEENLLGNIQDLNILSKMVNKCQVNGIFFKKVKRFGKNVEIVMTRKIKALNNTGKWFNR